MQQFRVILIFWTPLSSVCSERTPHVYLSPWFNTMQSLHWFILKHSSLSVEWCVPLIQPVDSQSVTTLYIELCLYRWGLVEFLHTLIEDDVISLTTWPCHSSSLLCWADNSSYRDQLRHSLTSQRASIDDLMSLILSNWLITRTSIVHWNSSICLDLTRAWLVVTWPWLALVFGLRSTASRIW